MLMVGGPRGILDGLRRGPGPPLGRDGRLGTVLMVGGPRGILDGLRQSCE